MQKMAKPTTLRKSGNVIFFPEKPVDAIIAEKEKHFLTAAALYEKHNNIEAAIHCYAEANNYVKAANLADLINDKELRSSLCEEGIGYCHKMLVLTSPKRDSSDDRTRFTKKVSVYMDMYEPYSIKRDPVNAKMAMEQCIACEKRAKDSEKGHFPFRPFRFKS